MQPTQEPTKKPKGFAYIRLVKDGTVKDIPIKDLEKTLKKMWRGKPMFEYVGEIKISTDKITVPIIEEKESTEEQPPVVESNTVNCPLDGKEFKNENGLRLHKTNSHK